MCDGGQGCGLFFGGTVKCFQPKHRPLKSLARILIRTDTRALFSDVIKKGIIQCEQHDAASDRGRGAAG